MTKVTEIINIIYDVAIRPIVLITNITLFGKFASRFEEIIENNMSIFLPSSIF